MREQVLRDFFEGRCDAQVLAIDIHGSVTKYRDTTRYLIEPMEHDFEVQCQHFVAICEAVLKGDLKPEDLEIIGNCIVGSDSFEYDVDTVDGGRVGDAAIDWATPLANYPLTMPNVDRWQRRLLGETVEPRLNGT